MEPVRVAEALVAHLFLQPACVRTLLRYWCRSHMPVFLLHHGGGGDRGGSNSSGARAELRAAVDGLFRQLAAVPSDLTLRGLAGGLPTKTSMEPRPVFVLTLQPGALAIGDELLLRSGWPALIDAYATMCQDADRYWGNVAEGDMRGHVVAELFRWPELLRRLYSPAYMLLVACRLVLDSYRDEWRAAAGPADDNDNDRLLTDSAEWRDLCRVLADAVAATLAPPAVWREGERALLAGLLDVLRRDTAGDADADVDVDADVRGALAAAAANLDADMLALYRQLRAAAERQEEEEAEVPGS